MLPCSSFVCFQSEIWHKIIMNGAMGWVCLPEGQEHPQSTLTYTCVQSMKMKCVLIHVQ